MVHTPGGIRCPDCAQMRRPPMYELETKHYLRAAAVAIPAAALFGVIGAFLLPPSPFAGLLRLVLGLVAGAAAGSAVAAALDRATNRKRGLTMQLFAAAAMAGAFAIRLVLSGEYQLVIEDAAGAVMLGVGVLVAWNRLA